MAENPKVRFLKTSEETFNTHKETLDEYTFYKTENKLYLGQKELTNQVTGVKGSNEEEFQVGNVTITKDSIDLGKVDNTPDAEKNVLSATKLANIRTILTDLASTNAADFDGTKNITPGVKGILGLEHGGTGNETGTAQYLDSHAIEAGTDLNNLTNSGFYVTANAQLASGFTNCPINEGSLALCVIKRGPVNNSQILVTQASSDDVKMFIRSRYSDKWGDWIEIYSEHNPQTDITGNAGSADKLNTSAGSEDLPVYFKDGIPVPVNPLEDATKNKSGLMSPEDKAKLDSLEPGGGGGSGYTLPVASTILGGVKSGTDISVDDEGNVSVVNNSHDHTIGNVTGLQTELNNKVPQTRTINGKPLSGNITLNYEDVQAIPATDKGANNGVATLNEEGKIPSSQLPGYVDDVVEGYLNNGKFYEEATHETEIPGTSGKIYIDLHTSKTYRWSGSIFSVISETLALGTTSSTAFYGDRGQTAYTHATAKGTQLSSGLYKITTNAQGHVTAGTKVEKDDIVQLGIPDKDTTYNNAVANGAAGLMTGADKAKLDSIDQGANNYELPTASEDTLGGVKTGFTTSTSSKDYAVNIDEEGNLHVKVPWTDTNTWTANSKSSSGYVTSGGSHPNKVWKTNENGEPGWRNDDNTTYGNATDSTPGLMSAEDKAKLNSVAQGANAYILPTASATVKGGITLGYSSSAAKTYPLKLDTSGKAYVEVPWENTVPTWNTLTGKPSFADVATSGSYSDLIDTPKIPTKTSDLVNDSNFRTTDKDTWIAFKGATTTSAGTAGYVPAPETGETGLFFKSDGTWAAPTDTKYVLPVAKTNALGGIQVGYTTSSSGKNYAVTVDGSGNAYVHVPWTNTTYNNAVSGGAAGLMTGADKAKLDAIDANANKYVLPTADETTLGGIKIGFETTGKDYAVEVDTSGNAHVSVPWVNTTYNNAVSGGAAGLMTGADKAKLDAIDAQANKYTLPVATASTLGGVKSGTDITVDASGNVSVVNNSHSHTIGNVTNLQTELDAKVPKTTTVNGKALSGNITLSYSDVQAIPASDKGANGGVATLGTDGKVPSSQLPSYVDDVLEGYLSGGKFYKEATHDTEIPGEAGKIYVDLTSGKTYRWSGTAFSVISETLALGTTSSTAFYGDKGQTAYEHATAKGTQLASGLYKITTNAQGHVTAGTKVEKADITGLGIPGSDTTYGNAVAGGVAGLMTGADKAKLDEIANGANAYSLPTASATVKGGVKTGFTTTGKDYAVSIDTSGNLHVNVPWENTTYGTATSGSAGLMSSADKSKLDKIDNGANNYVLPTATTSRLGGVKAGGDISVDDTGSVTVNHANSASLIEIAQNEVNFANQIEGSTTLYIGYRAGGSQEGNSIDKYRFYNCKDGLSTIEAAKFIGPLQGNADTATTANKTKAALSWSGASTGSFDGSTAKSFVIPTLGSLMGGTAIGSASKPVYWNGTGFVAGNTIPSAYSLPTASSTTKGGVLLGYTGTDSKNYPLQVDTSGKAYVNVPWTDTNTTYTLAGLVGLSAIGSASAPVYWNGSKFVQGNTIPSAYSLPTASSTVKGGVQLGYSASGKYYALQVDSSGKAYVYVPWSDTNTWIKFQGATSSAAGTAGYVPAPTQGQTTLFLKSDGTWATPTDTKPNDATLTIKQNNVSKGTFTANASTSKEINLTDTTYSVMGKATTSAGGASGLVPASSAGDQSKFLRADGTWVVPTDTKYTLPIATSSILGGVKSGGDISINSSSGAVTVSHATAADKLSTAHTINGVGFDGSGNIQIYDYTRVAKAGDIMTGNLTFSSATTPLGLKFAGAGGRVGTPIMFYPSSADGSGIVIGDGGRTIIGGGESATALRTELDKGSAVPKDADERMDIASDGYIYFHTGCQDMANHITTFINSQGHMEGLKTLYVQNSIHSHRLKGILTPIDDANKTDTTSDSIYLIRNVRYSEFGSSIDTVDYLQNILKWICTNYPKVIGGIFIGGITPNRAGFMLIRIYDTNDVSSDTKLPRYSYGFYVGSGTNHFHLFGTNLHIFYEGLANIQGSTVTKAETAIQTQAALSWSGAASGSFNGRTAASFTIPTWSTLSGKPSLSPVATSGSYNDLTDTPTIPSAGVGLTNSSGKFDVTGIKPTNGTTPITFSDSSILPGAITYVPVFAANGKTVIGHTDKDYFLDWLGDFRSTDNEDLGRGGLVPYKPAQSANEYLGSDGNWHTLTPGADADIYKPSGIFVQNTNNYFFKVGSTAYCSGQCSIAFGKDSVHAEGDSAFAFGEDSFAQAFGSGGALALGVSAIATSTQNGEYECPIALGYEANATSDNEAAIAIGYQVNAEGRHSVSIGDHLDNSAQYCTCVGTYNKTDTMSANCAFVVGNGQKDGVRSNALRVTHTDGIYAAGSYHASGADYAEYMKEWADGNPDNEDRIGYFVTIKNKKLYIAEPGDYISGITSGDPCIIGNGDEDYYWRYERDEFNRLKVVHPYKRKVSRDENGKIITDKSNNPIYIEDELDETRFILKQREDYDPTLPYIHRKDRPEWDAVGMKGVLPVRDDGTCIPDAFCKCSEGGIATFASERGFDTFYVIERINDHVVSVQI